MRRLARRCEDVGDGAVAGADLDDGAFADVAESVCDGVAGVVVDEKVLSEFGFLLHRCLILWRTVPVGSCKVLQRPRLGMRYL